MAKKKENYGEIITNYLKKPKKEIGISGEGVIEEKDFNKYLNNPAIVFDVLSNAIGKSEFDLVKAIFKEVKDSVIKLIKIAQINKILSGVSSLEISESKLAIIKLIVDKYKGKSPLNEKESDLMFSSSLLSAINLKDIETVKYFLSKMKKVGKASMESAIKSGDLEIAKSVLNKFDLNDKKALLKAKDLLLIAAKQPKSDNKLAIIKHLVDEVCKGKPVLQNKEEKSEHPLFEAIKLNDLDTVKYLILEKKMPYSSGIRENTDTGFLNPLQVSSSLGHFEILKILIENLSENCNNVKASYILSFMAFNPPFTKLQKEIAELIINKKLDINESWGEDDVKAFHNPMQAAIYSWNLEFVEYLIEKGFKFNKKIHIGIDDFLRYGAFIYSVEQKLEKFRSDSKNLEKAFKILDLLIENNIVTLSVAAQYKFDYFSSFVSSNKQVIENKNKLLEKILTHEKIEKTEYIKEAHKSMCQLLMADSNNIAKSPYPNIGAIKILLENGVDLNNAVSNSLPRFQDKQDDFNVLSLAALNADRDFILYLIDKGASFLYKNKTSQNIIHILVKADAPLDNFKVILEKIAETKNFALATDLDRNKFSPLELLLCTIDRNSHSPKFISKLEIFLDWLLNHSADVNLDIRNNKLLCNKYDITLLHKFKALNNEKINQILIKHGYTENPLLEKVRKEVEQTKKLEAEESQKKLNQQIHDKFLLFLNREIQDSDSKLLKFVLLKLDFETLIKEAINLEKYDHLHLLLRNSFQESEEVSKLSLFECILKKQNDKLIYEFIKAYGVNTRDETGFTLLYKAIERSDINAVNKIIAAAGAKSTKIDLIVQYKGGFTIKALADSKLEFKGLFDEMTISNSSINNISTEEIVEIKSDKKKDNLKKLKLFQKEELKTKFEKIYLFQSDPNKITPLDTLFESNALEFNYRNLEKYNKFKESKQKTDVKEANVVYSWAIGDKVYKSDDKKMVYDEKLKLFMIIPEWVQEKISVDLFDKFSSALNVGSVTRKFGQNGVKQFGSIVEIKIVQEDTRLYTDRSYFSESSQGEELLVFDIIGNHDQVIEAKNRADKNNPNSKLKKIDLDRSDSANKSKYCKLPTEFDFVDLQKVSDVLKTTKNTYENAKNWHTKNNKVIVLNEECASDLKGDSDIQNHITNNNDVLQSFQNREDKGKEDADNLDELDEEVDERELVSLFTLSEELCFSTLANNNPELWEMHKAGDSGDIDDE